MESVGESFKSARKNQEIDINTVSQDLKIDITYHMNMII